MQLEFDYLSAITGDKRYAEKADHVMDYIVKRPKPANGMYPNYINQDNGNWCASKYLFVSCVLRGAR